MVTKGRIERTFKMGNEESGFARGEAGLGHDILNPNIRQHNNSSPPPRNIAANRPSQSPMVTQFGKNDSGNKKFTPRDVVGKKNTASIKSSTGSTSSNVSGGNRARRTSVRAPAIKRGPAIAPPASMNAPTGPGILKRTKSNMGTDFFRDSITDETDIDTLTEKIGSRRLSITSNDSENDQIANIVAMTAANMKQNNKGIKQEKQVRSTKPSRSPTALNSKSGVKAALGKSVSKLFSKTNPSLLSRSKSTKTMSAVDSKLKAGLLKKASSFSTKSAPAKKNGKTKSNRYNTGPTGGPGWSIKQDARLKELIDKHGMDWKAIKAGMPGRSEEQCIHRWNKVLKPGLRKGTWTSEEDALLIKLVYELKKRNWGDVAALIEGRTAKQCRERWCYNLDPSINKNVWTPEEDQILIKSQSELGNRWAHIASLLPGRTENAVKTRFKSIMRAKKREWLPEEDAMILKMHQEKGSRWEEIAEHLPSRTKNAVKTRFRLLGKGLAQNVPEVGSPNQVLRDPGNLENMSLADLTKKVKEAHKQRTSMQSLSQLPAFDRTVARNQIPVYEYKDEGRQQGRQQDNNLNRKPGMNIEMPEIPNQYNGNTNITNNTQNDFLGQLDLFNNNMFGTDNQNGLHQPSAHTGYEANTYPAVMSQNVPALNAYARAGAAQIIPGIHGNANSQYTGFEEGNDDGIFNNNQQESAPVEDDLMEFFDMWEQGSSKVEHTKA